MTVGKRTSWTGSSISDCISAAKGRLSSLVWERLIVKAQLGPHVPILKKDLQSELALWWILLTTCQISHQQWSYRNLSLFIELINVLELLHDVSSAPFLMKVKIKWKELLLLQTLFGMETGVNRSRLKLHEVTLIRCEAEYYKLDWRIIQGSVTWCWLSCLFIFLHLCSFCDFFSAATQRLVPSSSLFPPGGQFLPF